MNWNPPEQEGELVGQITDTKSSLLRVFRLEDGATLLRADQPYPEHYEDPTPHMTAAMALVLSGILAESAGLKGLSEAAPPTVIGRSERGFKDFGEAVRDTKGQLITVRESSAVGQPCVWVFCSCEKVEQARYDRHKAQYESGEVEPTMRTGYWRGEEAGWSEQDSFERWFRTEWVADRHKNLDPRVFPCMDAKTVQAVIDRLVYFAVDAQSSDNWRNTPEYRAVWRKEGENAL